MSRADGAREPLREFVLGAWGIEEVAKRSEARRAEFEQWRVRGVATDFDAA